MFTSVTESGHKEKILQLFNSNDNLRVLVATITFGMGVDCPNVRQIIHVGSPYDVSSYVQETGKTGRDGLVPVVTLLQTRQIVHVGSLYDVSRYVQETGKTGRDGLVSVVTLL